MKDILKILIALLALVGFTDLCLFHHWVGAVGVFLYMYTNANETSEAMLRIVKKADEWRKDRKKKKEEKK